MKCSLFFLLLSLSFSASAATIQCAFEQQVGAEKKVTLTEWSIPTDGYQPIKFVEGSALNLFAGYNANASRVFDIYEENPQNRGQLAGAVLAQVPVTQITNSWSTTVTLQVPSQRASIKCIFSSRPVWEGAESNSLIGQSISKNNCPAVSADVYSRRVSLPAATRQMVLSSPHVTVREGTEFDRYLEVPAFMGRGRIQGRADTLWQCTEYSDRFYREKFGMPVATTRSAAHWKLTQVATGLGHAWERAEKIHSTFAQDRFSYGGRSVRTAFFENGCSTHLPTPGSMIAFSWGTQYGHIAIVNRVETVSSNVAIIYITQQNGFTPHVIDNRYLMVKNSFGGWAYYSTYISETDDRVINQSTGWLTMVYDR